MFGLAYLLFLGVYIAISASLVKYSMKMAQQKKVAPWIFGGPIALLMYLLVAWEDIPTLAAYEYYCDSDSGFVVYKTVDEWVMENPGVAEMQKYGGGGTDRSSNDKGYTNVLHVSERFDYVHASESIFLTVRRIKTIWIDSRTSNVLAEVINYRSGKPFDGGTLTGLKSWLHNSKCRQVTKKDYLRLDEFSEGFRMKGGQKK